MKLPQQSFCILALVVAARAQEPGPELELSGVAASNDTIEPGELPEQGAGSGVAEALALEESSDSRSSERAEPEQSASSTHEAGAETELSDVEVRGHLVDELQSQIPSQFDDKVEHVQFDNADREARRLDHIEGPPLVDNFHAIHTLAGGAGQGSALNELYQPYSSMMAGGYLYISDTWNHRVLRRQPDDANDMAGNLLAEVVAGGKGAGPGLDQLHFPKSIWVEGGDLYVADAGNNRVVKWPASPTGAAGAVVAGEPGRLTDKQGNMLGFASTCCRGGRKERQLSDPHGVFVNSTTGDIYVADTGNGRIQRWSADQSVVETVAGDGLGPLGSLRQPKAVFVSEGELFVADTGNHRVVAGRPGSNGTVVAGDGSLGPEPWRLAAPHDVWVTRTRQVLGASVTDVYVCDTFNHRIVRFIAGGENTEPEDVAGGCILAPEYISPCIQGGLHYPPNPAPDRYGVLNPSNGNPPIYHFWGPTSVQLEESPAGDNIVVTDTQNHRVLSWDGYR